MLSKYFEMKTSTESFKQSVKDIIRTLKDKKVLIYGAGEGFFALNKQYHFTNELNIVAIADKKFKTDNTDITGLTQIEPKKILEQEYDYILVSNEVPKQIVKFLTGTLELSNDKVITLFEENIKDEVVNINYLSEQKFDKTLPKLIKKLQGKSVLLYGAGVYFELINAYYDLSGLNIIGIADKRFQESDECEYFLGYKTYRPGEIVDIKPDYVLVTTKYYIPLIENLYYKQIKGTGIKIKPLVKKSFWTLLREIWN